MELGSLLILAAMLSASSAFVRSGPKIIRQPVDTLYDSGSNVPTVSLFCQAEGVGPLTISWKKDDFFLNPEEDNRFIMTADRLTINDPQRSQDEGVYQCIVSNEYGTIMSQKAKLQFAYVNSYLVQTLPDQELEINTGGCISCSPPDHFPGLEVLWHKNTQQVATDKRVKVTADGQLCFVNVESGDAGTYFCLIKSNINVFSAAATYKRSPSVQVNTVTGSGTDRSPPRYLVGTPNMQIKVGEDIIFECVFSGSPHPEIQWRRKSPADQALPSNSNQVKHNQQLVIRDVQIEDSGEYECLGSNELQEGVNSVRTLTVVSAPTWVDELEDIEIDIYSSLTWHCEAESPDDVGYEWYRNVEKINSDPSFSFSNNFRTVTFDRLEEEDSGMYQCVASNLHGSVYSTGQLKVNAVPPSFPIPVQMNQPAARGGSVLIICDPIGAPKPTIKWYRGSSVITTGGRYNVTDEGNLHITDLVDGDAVNYRCEATNSFSTVSSTGSLVIKDGTNIIHPPADKTIVINTDGVIECEATADDEFELIYIWLFEGRQLNIDDNPHYRKEDGNLHLLNVNQEMEGEYTCRAETSIDADMATVTIAISGPPDPPTAVDVTLDDFMAEIRWLRGEEHSSPTTGFVIESKTNHQSNWMEEKRMTSISEMATVSDLSPWSIYQFRVRAMSDLGLGEPSAPSAEVETPPAGPTVSPSGISGGGGNVGDLRITWQPLDGADQNGPGIYYIVHWKQQGSANQFATTDVRTGENVHIVSNVPVYTPYEVKVQAGNDAGTGPISDITIVYSYQEAPADPPTEVDAKPSSGTQVVLKWSPVDDSNFQGVLTGYRIYYWPAGSSQDDADIVETDGTGTMVMIDDLKFTTQYFFVIEALSGGGEGPASQEVTVTTRKLAPLTAPQIETAQVQKGNTVKLSWSSITTGSTEEPLSGYKILFWKKGTFMESADSVEVKKEDTSYTLRTLDPSSTYYIKVRGFSPGGDGALSQQETVETGKPSTGYNVDGDGGSGHMITSFTSLIGSLLLMSMLLLLN